MKKLYTLLLILLSVSVSAQTVFYVNSGTGNDSNDGLSQIAGPDSGPKASITSALETAMNGDVLSIASGAYPENVVITKGISLLKTGSSNVTITSVTFSFGGQLLSPLPSATAFSSELVTVNTGSKINDAIAMVSVNGTVVVNDGGSYNESVFLNKSFNLIGINAPEVNDFILAGQGIKVVLEGSFNVVNSLQFNRPEGGKLELSSGFITLLPGATATTGNNASYAISSGSGKILSALDPAGTIFPVGTENTYAPVTISGLDSGTDFVAVSVSPAGSPFSFNPDLPEQVNSHVRLQWSLISNVVGNATIRFDYTGSSEPSNWNTVQNRVVAGATVDEYIAGLNSIIGESYASAEFPGAKGTFAIYSDFPNSLPFANSSFEASAYPNPFAEVLNLNLQGQAQEKVSIDVMDLSGRILSSEALVLPSTEYTHTLNTSALNNAGLFLVRIQSENSSSTIRVVRN
ncbi:MAG: T9SS type A sorting domain-containing protein [Bacteroidia bacterium]